MRGRANAIISAVCVLFLLINLNLFISQNELASQRLDGFTDDGRAGNQTAPETSFIGIRSISPSHASTAGGDLINIATENISFTENQDIIIFHDGNSTLENVGVNIPYSQRGGEGIEGDWTFLDDYLANLSISWGGMQLQFNHTPFTNTMIMMPFLVPGNTTITATLVNGSGGPTENLSVETHSEATVYVQEVIPDLEIRFGDTLAEDVSHIGGGMLEVISPPMPYGNHSVAVVLPDGSVYWVIDELRHINYHTYTGADVNWTVPDGVDEVTFKLWGAGGGSGDSGTDTGGPMGDSYYQSGGAGGYVEGTLEVNSGQKLTLMVGKAGARTAQYQEYSGGGFVGQNAYYSAGHSVLANGGGGGLTGIFLNNTTQEDALLIAGGGGGAGVLSQDYLDAGLITNGGIGAWPAGTNGGGATEGGGIMAEGGPGGNQTSGGTGASSARNTGGSGSPLLGGVSHASGNTWYAGGAGGAGYFGGGGSAWMDTSGRNSAGGGGGSSYYNSTFITGFNHLNGTNQSAPNALDSDYVLGIGIGAEGGLSPDPLGGNGLIVIITEGGTSILFGGIDNGTSTSEPEQLIGIKDVSPKTASTQGGDSIQIELENISFSETQQITVFNSGNATVEDAIINLPTAPIGLEGKVGCWSTGSYFNGLSFEMNGEDLAFNLTIGFANVLIPELLLGNNSIIATFNPDMPIPSNDNLSSGLPIAANFTIEYPVPDLGIWFGNSKALESRHLGDMVIESTSPPMPYGNHSIAVVLPDGSVYWVIDELRHINYHTYTGADVNWTVPDGVDEVTFKLWGAGGGSTASSNGSGGAGGYSEGTFSTNPGDVLKLVVGEGGAAGTANGAGAASYGGGGAGGPRNYSDFGGVGRHGGAGGGYSGIFQQQSSVLIEYYSENLSAGSSGWSENSVYEYSAIRDDTGAQISGYMHGLYANDGYYEKTISIPDAIGKTVMLNGKFFLIDSWDYDSSVSYMQDTGKIFLNDEEKVFFKSGTSGAGLAIFQGEDTITDTYAISGFNNDWGEQEFVVEFSIPYVMVSDMLTVKFQIGLNSGISDESGGFSIDSITNFGDMISQANALLISGGGGGSGFQYGPTPSGDGGHGGGLVGGDAPNVGNYPENWGGYGATGGTQDAGGAIGKAWFHGGSVTEFRTATAGSALQGGNGGDRSDDVGAGGGGGGGYFGGGGGAGAQPGIGGGGGSGYFNNTSISDSILLPGNGTIPPEQNNSDYVSGFGTGANIGNGGGHGLIVIITENETSILYDGLGEEAPNDESENEASEEESIEAEEAPKFFEEPFKAITYFITENPAEAVVVTGSTGGLGIYLIGFRRQRNELKEALSATGAWRTTGGAHLKSSFKALGILRKARAAAFTLGPLSWAWDEMLFASMSKKLAEYGISDVITLEGLISWLVFDVLGLTFTSPVALKEEFFPIVRMISTVLFIFFIYWVFLKRDSLLNKAKDMGDAEVEERKERIEQPRKGYD